jgi:hypothetical protein
MVTLSALKRTAVWKEMPIVVSAKSLSEQPLVWVIFLFTATAPGMKRGELTLTLIEGSVRPSLDRYEDYTLKEEIKGEIDNLL